MSVRDECKARRIKRMGGVVREDGSTSYQDLTRESLDSLSAEREAEDWPAIQPKRGWPHVDPIGPEASRGLCLRRSLASLSGRNQPQDDSQRRAVCLARPEGL